MLHVLSGLEGSYVRYSETFDPKNIAHLLKGPDYLINMHLNPTLKDIIKRLMVYGKIYFALRSFSEIHSTLDEGQIIHDLCNEISSILKDYEYFLYFEVEQEFKNNSDFSITYLEQMLSMRVAPEFNHLYEIITEINRENERRSDRTNMANMRFQSIMKSLKEDYYTGTLDGVTSDSRRSNSVKGGLALRIIQNRLDRYKGDMSSFTFLSKLLTAVSKSYVRMLNCWLELGIIDDPADEFLIHQNTTTNTEYSRSADFWADKFTIRDEGQVTQLEPLEVQKKIILTGKYLNVLDECGIDVHSFDGFQNQIVTLQDADLYERIDEAYMRANKLILKLLFQGYHLREFLESLNKYFLITDNHQFDVFLGHATFELRKDSRNLSLSKLTKQYNICFFSDTAPSGDSPTAVTNQLVNHLVTLRLSDSTLVKELAIILNTQTTDSDEVFSSTNINSLKNLLNATLEANKATPENRSNGTKVEEYSLNKLYLELEIPFPLNLIITRSQIFEYQLMFRNLLLLRYVEKSLNISWKEIGYQKYWTYRFNDSVLRTWVKRCRHLHFRMSDFVKMFSSYINFYVINENWKNVEFMFKKLDQGENVELEMLFITIKSFLSTILGDSLSAKMKLIEITHQLFVIVLLYHDFLMSLRMSLVLLDEDLFSEMQTKLPPNATFDPQKNIVRIAKLSDMLQKYEKRFDVKLREFMEAIRYYGEIDTPALLTLFDMLATAVNIDL
ncbi:unnamed protein product [Ambrosiozyma monospora]|uniref:Spindle pole body component n=1 Tax=Ambrosiozyma monospora TaxID=43982 RepID=A0A9W6YP14_AMBMO|nr:unnamed protein product [Ambrosiozyma monospora]